MTNTIKTKLNIFTDKPAKNQTLSEEQKELRKKITQILTELDPKEETVLRQRYGMNKKKPSTLEEVGEYIGVTRKRIMQIEQNALKKLKQPENARKLRSCLEDSPKALNTTKKKNTISTDKQTKIQPTSEKQKDLKKIVTQILAELDPKEETVLRQRFGMSTNKTSTLEEVGEYIGVTRERVREIEQKALNKLKHPTRARKLRSLLED